MRLAQPLLHAMKSNKLNYCLATTLIGLAVLSGPSAAAKSGFGYGDAVVEGTAPQQRNSTGTQIETFRGLDKNRDGFVSRSEMRDSPRYSAWRVIDRNRDGKISSREYSDFRAHRERSSNLNSAGATEPVDYGDPYLNSRLRKNTAPDKGLSESGPESESHYEEVLRKSNLERERRKIPAGY